MKTNVEKYRDEFEAWHRAKWPGALLNRLPASFRRADEYANQYVQVSFLTYVDLRLTQEAQASAEIERLRAENADYKAGQERYEDLCEEQRKKIRYLQRTIDGMNEAHAEVAQRLSEAKALSVENIMLDVTPGFDGMGEEIYAKSVADVHAAFGNMVDREENQQSEIERLRSRIKELGGALQTLVLFVEAKPNNAVALHNAHRALKEESKDG